MAQPQIEVQAPPGDPVVAEATAKKPEPQPAHQKLGSIKARVRKVGELYTIEIPAGLSLPPGHLVHASLKPSIRAKVPLGSMRYDSLQMVMNDSIRAGKSSATDWVDAIAQAMIQDAVNRNPEGFVSACAADSSNLVELAAGAPAYMAVGNMLFRLTPTAALDKSGPLGALKKVAQERALAAAKILIDAAKAEAQMLISTAEGLKREARAALDRAARENKNIIPTWITSEFLMRKSDKEEYPLEIQLSGTFSPMKFTMEHRSPGDREFKVYEWDCPSAPGYEYKFWLPLNPVSGRYVVSGCRMAQGFSQLPHFAYDRLCGKVEGIPDAILSRAQLFTARTSIVRAMNGFNLNSPLTNYGSWAEPVKAFVPKALRDYLSEGGTMNLSKAIEGANENRKVQEILDQTWTR